MGFGSFMLFEMDWWIGGMGHNPLNYHDYYSTYSANKNYQGLDGISQISLTEAFFDTVSFTWTPKTH